MKITKTFIRATLVGLLGLAVSLTFTSCDVLDVEPAQSVSSDVALSDLSSIRAVLGSTYDDLQDVTYYGQYFVLYPDALADNAINRPGFTRYNNLVVNSPRSHLNRWGGHYDSINKMNLILASLDNLSEESQSVQDRVAGESYFLRALNYFDLVRTKAYMPGAVSGGFTQGVVIRTEPTQTQGDALDFRPRSSISEVYSLIEDDLQQAISLMEGTSPVLSPSSESYVANEAAAQALLAQVYLYEKSFSDAASMASNALASAESELNATLLTQDDYVNALIGNNSSSAIFTINMEPNQDGDATTVNESLSSLTHDTTSFNFQLLPTEDLIEAYDSDDVRRALFDTVGVGGGSQRISKYTQADGEGSHSDDIDVIRVAEVLLIRAEARAESGDGSGALADVNQLREERGLESVSLSGDALIEEIMTQKRLELAFEGERFFDLKRRGMDIPKPQSIGTLPFSDYRILAPLPAGDVAINPQLDQNPGY